MTTVIQSRPNGDVSTDAPPGIGRTELGAVTIDDRVVAKIAARAALEVLDAGGAAPRILGRSLDGLKGSRDTSLDSLPKVSADVDGHLVVVGVQISVRWPKSVPQVCTQVRRRVSERVTAITGLTVSEINISVTDLVTHLAPPSRVS
jgi:uncharacterized alkaline shock family protein YloU